MFGLHLAVAISCYWGIKGCFWAWKLWLPERLCGNRLDIPDMTALTQGAEGSKNVQSCLKEKKKILSGAQSGWLTHSQSRDCWTPGSRYARLYSRAKVDTLYVPLCVKFGLDTPEVELHWRHLFMQILLKRGSLALQHYQAIQMVYRAALTVQNKLSSRSANPKSHWPKSACLKQRSELKSGHLQISHF